MIFYNNATGSNLSSAGAADNAIDPSKSALRTPGATSTFANYTNYSRGLNGLIVDITGLPSTTTSAQILSNLQFSQWNGIEAIGFKALPAASVPTVVILTGRGASGSARVKITFPDNTLQNTWLRVTVLANAQTGLATNDVFYFGNVIGELDFGNTATRLRVNGQDAAFILANQSPGANSAGVTNKFDLDRNGRVNGQDYAILLDNQQAAGIVAPLTAPFPRPAASRGSSIDNGGSVSWNSGAVPLPPPGAPTKSIKDTSDSRESQNLASITSNGLLGKAFVPDVSKSVSVSSSDLIESTTTTGKETKNEDNLAWEYLDSIFASFWMST
jgi:hypothetical protein